MSDFDPVTPADWLVLIVALVAFSLVAAARFLGVI